MKNPDPPPAPGKPAAVEFDAFREFVRQVVTVPKAEIDKREAEYQKRQADKPKRGPKPN